jgi:DNA-binding transcriptional LysR family regulator
MDTELARTFLEIVSAGSFVRASERLNVAQTTVSARMRILEQRIGRRLLIRNKAGVALTPAGEQFLRYAPAFLQLWQRVRHAIAVPEGFRTLLSIGSEVSLWEPMLRDWVIRLRASHPDIALRVHVDVPWDLIDRVAAGVVDIAVVYAPPHRPGLRIDLLLDEKLVLVTAGEEGGSTPAGEFVTVEWGPDFAREFSSAFPDAEDTGLSFDFGPLALDYMRSVRGRGYFRMHSVAQHLATGALRMVPGAPQFSFPIYVVTSSNSDTALLAPAIEMLREVAQPG